MPSVATLDRLPRRLAEGLILDELFDLSLYQRFRSQAVGPLAKLLDELVAVEAEHLSFWKKFLELELDTLDWGRRIKLELVAATCRLFGPAAVGLVLEGIEIHGIRKYLSVWEDYRGKPLGEAVQRILNDEMGHEDEIVSQLTGQRISPERVRTIFLGFNDGLVEILGAVAGFFAALREPRLVLVAGVSVAAAGAFSMAAGAFAATSSEREMERTLKKKSQFLGREAPALDGASPLATAFIVGLSYFLGSSVPILPVLFGAGNAVLPALAGAAAAAGVSAVVAFLSGLSMARRVALNLSIIAGAVIMTTLIGALAHRLWGVSL